MFRLFLYEALELFRHETGRWPTNAEELVAHFGKQSYFVYATIDEDGELVYHFQDVSADDFDLEPVAVSPRWATYVAEGFGWKESIRVEYDGHTRGLTNRRFPVAAGIVGSTVVLRWVAVVAFLAALVVELLTGLTQLGHVPPSRRWMWIATACWATFVVAAGTLRATMPVLSPTDLVLYIVGLCGVVVASRWAVARLGTTRFAQGHGRHRK